VTASARALEIAHIAALAADAKQAEDIVAIDVSGPLPLTDVFFIASGRNERNVMAIAGEIEDKLLEAGVKCLRREGRSEGRWILLDFGEIIAHIFHEEDRMYYALERLWKDCPAVPLDLPGAEAATATASASADAAETVTETKTVAETEVS
jgi:ribosome-associated protein